MQIVALLAQTKTKKEEARCGLFFIVRMIVLLMRFEFNSVFSGVRQYFTLSTHQRNPVVAFLNAVVLQLSKEFALLVFLHLFKLRRGHRIKHAAAYLGGLYKLLQIRIIYLSGFDPVIYCCFGRKIFGPDVYAGTCYDAQNGRH